MTRLAEKIAENREWIKDWRDGVFSSTSRDAEGWPIEMHGVVLALEEFMDAYERVGRSADRDAVRLLIDMAAYVSSHSDTVARDLSLRFASLGQSGAAS